MLLHFTKYQGTGNDFIMLDNMNGQFDDLTISQIQKLCDRKFGIGADGLIKLEINKKSSFNVDYYNADGTKSFCGNGARCSVNFAHSLHLFEGNKVTFNAIDGIHEAEIQNGIVSLKMNDVHVIKQLEENTYELNTGSPHYVRFTADFENIDIVDFGRKIRYNETYKKEGINVNIIEKLGTNEVRIKTYERGVENETLSCGTGVTAAALAFAKNENLDHSQFIQILTQGGKLAVRFNFDKNIFSEIYLIGPAEKVYEGTISI